jgi:hypothetical protein
MQALINYDTADGALHTLYVGDVATLQAAETGLRSAVDEARVHGGTNLRVRMIDPSNGRCVYSARVPS